MIVAGIMTGTSLDGIDVAICKIDEKGGRTAVTLLSFYAAPYPADAKYLMNRALSGSVSLEDLSDLPFLLAKAFAEALAEAQQAWPADAIEAVAVHGQTLWHHPPISTWQVVSGSALATLTRLPVIHDFRAADVAVGGQGAPLVPLYDHLAIRDKKIDRVALNIGGMANITLLPADGSLESIRAFDTGPGNVLIDAICATAFGKRYDDEGLIAREGVVIKSAFEELKDLPFFAQEPPKSTGRELFGKDMAEDLYRRYANPSVPAEDLITTLTELTAWSVADHIKRYQPSTSEVIVSGGGARNTFLLERLKELLESAVVRSSAELGVDPDAKEAMCFAYLGWRTLQGLTGNVPTVTGAKESVVLGSVAKP